MHCFFWKPVDGNQLMVYGRKCGKSENLNSFYGLPCKISYYPMSSIEREVWSTIQFALYAAMDKSVILGIENCHIAQFFWNKIVPQRHQSSFSLNILEPLETKKKIINAGFVIMHSISRAQHIFCQGLQDKIPRPAAFCIFL